MVVARCKYRPFKLNSKFTKRHVPIYKNNFHTVIIIVNCKTGIIKMHLSSYDSCLKLLIKKYTCNTI